MKKLLTASNTKILKGEAKGWKTLGLHLAPANLSGFNVCPWASKGCTKVCLNTSGRGAMGPVQRARIEKTLLFKNGQSEFVERLTKEIASAEKSCKRKGEKLAIRLNLTSDISWEAIKNKEGKNLMEVFPEVQWYDYTKSAKRMENFLNGKLPANYSLTFSRSESNEKEVEKISSLGGNVAVVFRKKLPASWNGKRVVNGDEDDLRFLDPQNVIVGLVDKGKAKKDDSGFVVEAFLPDPPAKIKI
jgi:ribosomal protein L15